MKITSRIRTKAKEVAIQAYINPKEELLSRIEEELEKYITPDFIEKVRADLVKKQKPREP